MGFATLIYGNRLGKLSLGHQETCPRSWRLQVVQLELKSNCKAQTHSLPLGKGCWLIITSSSCWEGRPHTHAGPVKMWQRFLKVLLGSSECKLIRLACKSMVTLDLMTQIAESPEPPLVNIYQIVSVFYHEMQPLFNLFLESYWYIFSVCSHITHG